MKQENMHNKQGHPVDELFSKKLNDRAFDFDPAYWDEMQQRLDQPDNSAAKTGSKRFAYKRYLLALLLLIGGGLTYVLLTDRNHNLTSDAGTHALKNPNTAPAPNNAHNKDISINTPANNPAGKNTLQTENTNNPTTAGNTPANTPIENQVAGDPATKNRNSLIAKQVTVPYNNKTTPASPEKQRVLKQKQDVVVVKNNPRHTKQPSVTPPRIIKDNPANPDVAYAVADRDNKVTANLTTKADNNQTITDKATVAQAPVAAPQNGITNNAPAAIQKVIPQNAPANDGKTGLAQNDAAQNVSGSNGNLSVTKDKKERSGKPAAKKSRTRKYSIEDFLNAESKWEFEIYAGADQVTKNLTGILVPQSYVRKRSLQEKSASPISAGIGFTYHRNKFVFHTGLNYLQLGEKVQYDAKVTKTFSGINPVTSLPYTYDSTFINENVLKANGTSKIAYLEIPFAAGIKLGQHRSRLTYTLQAGVSFGVFLNASGNYIDTSLNGVFSLRENKNLFSKVTFSAMAMPSVNYLVTPNTELYLMPLFRWNLNPATRQDEPLMQKYRSSGLRIGVRMKL
jgi:hypothetical protein